MKTRMSDVKIYLAFIVAFYELTFYFYTFKNVKIIMYMLLHTRKD